MAEYIKNTIEMVWFELGRSCSHMSQIELQEMMLKLDLFSHVTASSAPEAFSKFQPEKYIEIANYIVEHGFSTYTLNNTKQLFAQSKNEENNINPYMAQYYFMWGWEMGFDLINVITVAEASEMWNLDRSTLKKALSGEIKSKHFELRVDCRKSGDTWLVTKAAMIREYGEPKKKSE